ncbi:unnamed protein product [Adineta ricciae]|uniref:Uncharacterized protein n=1 Tax=Adineta ricciae TaxID=249248 RepID=A0A814K753_ADIRI|nr:unnamed protein product [Adineta ricciae]
MSSPTRPTRPYISLDDEHTKHFFTKDRIKKHLRKAQLLNRNGEILTEAEYANRQRNALVRDENQKKIDDAIMEVLNDMAREHWAYARDYASNLEKNLRHEFRRIEKEFHRCTQPITIRYMHDGRTQIDPTNPVSDNHFSATKNSTRPSKSVSLPRIYAGRDSHQQQSSDESNVQSSTEVNDMRQQLDGLINELISFKRKFNIEGTDGDLERMARLEEQQTILSRKYEEERQRVDKLHRQFEKFHDQRKSSEKHNQQVQHSNQKSIDVKELHDRVLSLEISLRNSPSGLFQGAVNKDIAREPIHDTNEKVKIQSDRSLTRLEKPPNSVVHSDDHQSAKETINTNNPFQDQLSVLTKSMGEEPIRHTKSSQGSVSQMNKHFEQRFNDLEHRLQIFPSPSNLVLIEERLARLENRPRHINHHQTPPQQSQATRKLEPMLELNEQKISQMFAEIEERLQRQYQTFSDRIKSLLENKPGHGLVGRLIQESDTHEDQKILELQQSVQENPSNNFIRKSNRQPITTTSLPPSEENPYSKKELRDDALNTKELQAIMPFIEALPMFDIYNDNEWN